MTIFEAKELDPRAEARARRLRNGLISFVIAVLLAAALLWWFRYWPEEHVVDKFFAAIEKKDLETAFALWNADPQWRAHTERYKDYPYGRFELDWGPSGDYGMISSHSVKGAVAPKAKVSEVSGVVVVVQVNGRAEPACLWVEKKTKTITFSPYPCQF